ncbi:DNA polymerase iota [Bagarius yarrelli]|uniref:DNA polymerase iota n=1 Tax=Bagarius yarrelli TaxID=175774 RepID=A0A556UFX0_BAGYA|nr:DNA polymerase iota [Bagarius yarrelli]
MEDDPRVILHFDMDCFYAQVEMIRNPELRSKPLGVQQKYLIVTCNYVAREMGVAKLMSVKEALEKCPDLVLVRGEDLTFYREISYKVTELLMSYCPLVERLGLDENFLDVTEMVESRRSNTDISQLSFVGHIYGHDGSSVAVEDHVSLALGSVIACELREALSSRLGLTSCAGVANSKLLAKLVSGTTAERLKALGVLSVTDLQLFPLGQLVCEFGEANAKRIQSLARGIDLSPVTPAGPPQSLSDEDSFKKISTLSEAQSKITELLLSLRKRMCKDGRLPQTLRLTLRRSSAASRWFSRESRQSPIPTNTAHSIANGCPEAVPQLVSIAMRLLHKLVDVREPFHLTLLSVCFTNLRNKPSTKSSISSFFTSKHTPTVTHSFTQPKALCGTTNPQNDKETPSSSSPFFQQPITATTSVARISEASEPSHIPTHIPKLPYDVDPEVFTSLPQHIQLELMSSFQEDSVKRQDHYCVSAPSTHHSDDITQQHNDTKKLGDISDAAVSDVPPDVDPYVFSQLPTDVQRELRTEWRHSKLMLKMSTRHVTKHTATSRDKRPAAKRSHSGSLLSYFKPSSDKRP